MSEPDADELIRLGLDEIHVRHAFVEIARHVLARGWSVAYGGDLRAAGYTEALFDLVRTYNRVGVPEPDRVRAYLSWPLWQDMTTQQRADLTNVATINTVDRPDGAPASLPARQDRGPEDLFWSSLAFTRMRTQMNADISARVVLGGRVSGQQGFFPGIAEEAALAVRAHVPLYVAGGFGGCGRLVAELLSGSKPVELTVGYQLDHTPRYRELLGAAISAGREPSFGDLTETLAAAGISGLRNGLDEAENRRLMATDDVDEIVSLILQGLRQLSQQ